MYKRWYLANCSLHNFHVDYGKVDRKRLSELTVQDFIEEYDAVEKPMLISDGCKDWKAMQAWNKTDLVEKYGDVVFKISSKGKKSIKMALRDYVTYVNQQHDHIPLYIFDATFGEKAPGLLEDYKILPYFQENFYELLPKRPDYRWFVMGPVRSGTPWYE